MPAELGFFTDWGWRAPSSESPSPGRGFTGILKAKLK